MLSGKSLARLSSISLTSTSSSTSRVRPEALHERSTEEPSTHHFIYSVTVKLTPNGRGITFILQAIIFRIVPTALEISLVCGILVRFALLTAIRHTHAHGANRPITLVGTSRLSR